MKTATTNRTTTIREVPSRRPKTPKASLTLHAGSLQETHSRLEQALDHMIEGCQIISPDYRYLYLNQAAAKQGRQTKQKLVGHTMIEAYPGIEQTDMFRHLRRCMRTRRPQTMENEFRFPDGRKGWFELRMEPVPEGVLIFSADISKRKQAEQSLSERNAKLEALTLQQTRTKGELVEALEDLQGAKDEINLEKINAQAILENIGEGLIATDAQARIMLINKRAEALLGRRADELVGRPITSIPMLDADSHEVVMARRPIYKVLREGASIGPSLAGYRLVNPHGGSFPIGLTVTPIYLEGKIIGAIEVFRDVTREQAIDQAKTEFVSIASHQLRTPLGLTKWYLEAIREEGFDSLPTTIRSYFEEIHKSNERVLKVVRELLSVSRIDQGRVKDDPKRVDVSRLVNEIIEEITPMAATKRVQLHFRATGRAKRPAYIDRLRLHEVIQNLVANALEYTLAGGSVTVTVENRTRSIVVRVADTGIGIRKADQGRLFSKFFRSEAAALQNPDGSGLGLYVVKSYVEGWGGKVVVRSREGQGTTFTVTLPLKGGGRG